MFKNVINSKRKRDIINVRVFSIPVLILVCGLDLICAQRHCGLYFHRNLALRLRDDPTTIGPALNTTTGDPLLAAIYSIVNAKDPPSIELNTTIRMRRTKVTQLGQKKSLKTRSVTLKVPRPTLVRWKYIKTQWVTVPKRKWFKYNASLTTPYDIDARRKEKRREHRLKLKEQGLLRVERRKIPTSRKTTKEYTTFRFFLDLHYTKTPTQSTTLSTLNDTKTESTTPTTTLKSPRQIKLEKRAKIEQKKKELAIKRAQAEAAKQAREQARAEGKIVPEPEEVTKAKYTRLVVTTEGTTKDIWQILKDKKKGGKIGGLKRKIYHDDPANKQKYVRDKQAARDAKKDKHGRKKKRQQKQKKGKDGVIDKS